MVSRLVVAVAVTAHFAYLGYAVLGGFLAWRWPRALCAHLAAVGWMVIAATAGPMCPLTWLEDRGRERAGMPVLRDGFLDHYIAGVFYPRGHEGTAQIVVAVVVLASWAGVAVLLRRRTALR